MSEEKTPNESAEEQLPPFVIEGARSSRSRCKTCRRKIDKDQLRLGILFEGPYGTGYMWHHLKCAARQHMDSVEEAYRLEAWKNAKTVPGDLPPLEELSTLAEKAKVARKERKTLPYLELSPSGRAACKQCGESIAKDSVRIVLGKRVEFGNQVRVAPMTVHPACALTAIATGETISTPEGLQEELRENSGGLAEDLIEKTLASLE